MMAGKESVEPAMDTAEADISHPVDYYYLKALRYLSSGDSSNDCDENNSSCQQCGGDDDGSDTARNKVEGQRERSWSHSMAEEYESEAVGQLPRKQISNKSTGRYSTRRYSDGMLLKPGMKVSNGRVHWADDCQKELTRSRPRKKYVRNPALSVPPIKSILKNVSDGSLVGEDDHVTTDHSLQDTDTSKTSSVNQLH